MKLEKKLSLSKETLRSLNPTEAVAVAAGMVPYTKMLEGQDVCVTSDCVSFDTRYYHLCDL